ncbi:MAG: hypothetical protein AB7F59_08985 [Bdellovibrionales bacterium]
MKKIFIGLIVLVVIVGIVYIVFDKPITPEAMNGITGWHLPTHAHIKVIKQRWNGPRGESVWSIDKNLLSSDDLATFQPCKPINGHELLKRIPELTTQIDPNEAICEVFKERKDEYIFLYLTTQQTVVNLAI